MGDFELIGFPFAIVIGKKLKDGMVELISRKTGEKTDILLDEVSTFMKELKG